MEKLDLSYMGPMFKQARLAENMTQDELAERVGITSRFLQAIEGNERGVSLDTFIRFLNSRDRKALLASVRQMLETE